MLTAAQIAALRHAVVFRQRPIAGETVTLSFAGGPLDGLHVPVAPDSANCPFIGWATITDAGAVVAQYEGDPAETVRVFVGYKRPGRPDGLIKRG